MKKLLIGVISLVLCISLAACDQNPTTTVNTTTQNTQATQPTTSTATTATDGSTTTPSGTTHTHQWQNATCAMPKICVTCGETEGEPLGHTWNDGVVLKEATEEEPGEIFYTCTSCDETQTRQIPALNHQHDYAEAVITHPTCTEIGFTTYTCRCGDSYTAEEMPATGHAWQEATCISAKTCQTCGDTQGDALGHKWQEATCTEAQRCTVCGDRVGQPLEHNYTSVVTAPTCTEQGFTTHSCSRCQDTYRSDYVSAAGHSYANATCTAPQTCTVCGHTTGKELGHSWDDGMVIREATEATDGEMLYTCTVCSETKTLVIPSLEHVHSYTAATIAPTCTEDGYTVHTCRCGDSYITDETNALDHDWKAATCTAPKICKRCQKTEGDAKGHRWGEASCTAPKQCADCGETDGAPLGHNYAGVVTEPTCTEAGFTTHTCTRCSDQYVSDTVAALGHDFAEATCTTPKICKRCQKTEGGAKGHRWGEASCTASKQCADCGETDGAPLGHNYAGVVTEPTCTEAGFTTHTCTRCSDQYVSDTVAALDHDFAEATCTAPKICKRCDHTTGNVLGHTFGQWETVEAATCTVDGLARKSCQRCQHFETQTISATGHYYSDQVTKPTCTEDGYTTYTCTRCNDQYVSDPVAALGHNYAAEVIEPTCTEQGYTVHTCENCGDCYIIDYTTGEHNFVVEIVIDPTCLSEGCTIYVCTLCNGSITADFVDKIPHPEAITPGYPATCIFNGLTDEVYCGMCHEVLVPHEVIPATGHTETVAEAVAPTCTEVGLTEGLYCSACSTFLVEQEEIATIPHNFVGEQCAHCGCQAIMKLYEGESFVYASDDIGVLFAKITNPNGEYVLRFVDGNTTAYFTYDQANWPACRSIHFLCDGSVGQYVLIHSDIVAEYKLNSDLLIQNMTLELLDYVDGSTVPVILGLDLNGHDLTVDSTYMDLLANITNRSDQDSTLYTYASYNESHENYIDGGPWIQGSIQCENFIAYGFVRVFGTVDVDVLEAHKAIALQANDPMKINCDIQIDRMIIHGDLYFKGLYYGDIHIRSLVNETSGDVPIHIQGTDLTKTTFYIDCIEGNQNVVFYYAEYEIVFFWDFTGGEEDIYFDFTQNPDGSYTLYYYLAYGDCFIKTDMPDWNVGMVVIHEDAPSEWIQLSYQKDGYYYTKVQNPTSIDAAVAALRQGMVERQSSIYIQLLYTGIDAGTVAYDIFQQATAHTGVPGEGDSIWWQIASCTWSYGYQTDADGTTLVVLTYMPSYYTTAEQEAELDAAVKALLDELNLWNASDYEKIVGVYEWICQNVTYDYANLNDDSHQLKYTAYAALINRTAVCQGYSNLLYRLLLELGVDNRIISGVGNGGPHSWNIVLLDGKYYNVDATWDATYRQAGLQTMFFLLSDADFTDHIRDAVYTTEDFYAAYPMHNTSYPLPYAGRQYHSLMKLSLRTEICIAMPACVYKSWAVNMAYAKFFR